MHCGEVLDRPARQRAVELAERPRRRQLSRALDLRRAPARAAAAARICAAARAARPSRRGSPSGNSGCGSARRPSERRMRCTSTPITPEPSPRSPKAAIASRARSRIAPSEPSCSACGDLLAQRVEVDRSAPSKPSPSRTPCTAASASAARKKKRSKTSSKTRRSSGDFASVAASASLKSARSFHGTSRSAAKASSSSEVPIATPSPRSSSVKPSRRASRPAGGEERAGRERRRRLRHRALPRVARPRARRPCRGRCGA